MPPGKESLPPTTRSPSPGPVVRRASASLPSLLGNRAILEALAAASLLPSALRAELAALREDLRVESESRRQDLFGRCLRIIGGLAPIHRLWVIRGVSFVFDMNMAEVLRNSTLLVDPERPFHLASPRGEGGRRPMIAWSESSITQLPVFEPHRFEEVQDDEIEVDRQDEEPTQAEEKAAEPDSEARPVSAKEQRRLARARRSVRRRQEQEVQRETIHSQRSEKWELEALEAMRYAEGVKNAHLRGIQRSATAFLVDLEAVEPEAAERLTANAKPDAELATRDVIAKSAEGVDPDELRAQLHGAKLAFQGALRQATRQPRNKTEAVLLPLQAHLPAALAYNDQALHDSHQRLQELMARGRWFTARQVVQEVEQAVERLKPDVAFFDTLVTSRLPWVSARLGQNAQAALHDVMTRVGERHRLDAPRRTRLRNWLDANYMGTIERPETEAEFQAVMHNDRAAQTLLDQLASIGVIRSGGLAKKYRTSWDTQGGYSVEYTVQGIPQIVIHAHCDANGNPKQGNACHWKLKDEKFEPGKSHPISQYLIQQFIDPMANQQAKLGKE